MNIFVATNKTQGQRRNDFYYCNDQEMVWFPMTECSTGSIDDRCGCHRSMAGIDSRRATTTFEVIDFPGTQKEIEKLFFAGIQAAWGRVIPKEELMVMVKADVAEFIRMASLFDVGEVLERRGRKIAARKEK